MANTQPETRNPFEGLTWSQRLDRQIAFLKQTANIAATNNNGGTIVFAADAATLLSIVKELEELKTRIPVKSADYES